MLTSFPARRLSQGSDEELILEIGGTVYPGFVTRPESEHETGLRLWVEGDPLDPEAKNLAAAMFQTLLGALRVFRTSAGELTEERREGLGKGSVRDEVGNQFVSVGPVVAYALLGGEVEAFATNLRAAVEHSQALGNALWLNGRPGRTGADYFMIHEYAAREFGGSKGVRDALRISRTAQEKLTQSANNLSPLEGGRHARETGPAPWGLAEQRDFTADLLRRWIKYSASTDPAAAAQMSVGASASTSETQATHNTTSA